MKKPNIESPEDAKVYIKYLSKVRKEVDQLPPEEKTRRATVFYEDFKPSTKKSKNT